MAAPLSLSNISGPTAPSGSRYSACRPLPTCPSRFAIRPRPHARRSEMIRYIILTGTPGAGKTAVLFDRSPVCTLALSRYLGFAPSGLLEDEVERVVGDNVYESTVFFLRHQGSIQATEARQISFEDSLDFEQLHRQTYRDLWFKLAEVPAVPLTDRVALIQKTVERLHW